MSDTIEVQTEQETKEEIQAKFDAQEKTFADLEENISVLRKFFAEHREALSPFKWKCYGWDNEIAFYHYNQDAKAIARALGAEGWKREANGSHCGQIDWKKKIGEVSLTIVRAESIKPEIRENVRL